MSKASLSRWFAVPAVVLGVALGAGSSLADQNVGAVSFGDIEPASTVEEGAHLYIWNTTDVRVPFEWSYDKMLWHQAGSLGPREHNVFRLPVGSSTQFIYTRALHADGTASQPTELRQTMTREGTYFFSWTYSPNDDQR
jgi:hypothetical protein